MTAPADRRNLILSLDRWPGSASSAPHIHIQAQTLPTGITDLTTIDGPQLLKTLHSIRCCSAGPAWSGAATSPGRQPLILAAATWSALSADEVGVALSGCQSAIRR